MGLVSDLLAFSKLACNPTPFCTVGNQMEHSRDRKSPSRKIPPFGQPPLLKIVEFVSIRSLYGNRFFVNQLQPKEYHAPAAIPSHSPISARP